MATPTCYATKSLIADASCDEDSSPGIIRAYAFNKASVRSYATDTCGNITSLTLCDYCCALILEPEVETGSFEQTDTRTGSTVTAALALQGTWVLKNCTDVTALEEFYNAELVIIVQDAAGNYRIAGHVANLRGFKLSGLTFNSGAAAGDTITSTIRWTANVPAKKGGWKFFLSGAIGQDPDVRAALTAEYLNSISCTQTSEADCGCTPGE